MDSPLNFYSPYSTFQEIKRPAERSSSVAVNTCLTVDHLWLIKTDILKGKGSLSAKRLPQCILLQLMTATLERLLLLLEYRPWQRQGEDNASPRIIQSGEHQLEESADQNDWESHRERDVNEQVSGDVRRHAGLALPCQLFTGN
ncbi:hypothetical protein E2C01_024587 [Portunus trituberculatus]|uniref:Uncharacterized protein n=1 Tax=Portunus trituberculatus TaxID=210409 RepID=A0A5B7EAP8_PORTR|nr:hypothetical protein [Portunus trituberculatus]